jgi:type IV secretory pathway protease TraF
MLMLRRLETILVLVLVLLLLVLGLETRTDLFVYSPSPSVEHRLFVRAFRPPSLFDYVVFCAPQEASRLLREHGYPSHPRCPDEGVRLIKQVAVTRPGGLFVLGSHPRSVDSWTFGWIAVSDVFTVIPLDRARGASQP